MSQLIKDSLTAPQCFLPPFIKNAGNHQATCSNLFYFPGKSAPNKPTMKKTHQLEALLEKDHGSPVKIEHVPESLCASVYQRMRQENF